MTSRLLAIKMTGRTATAAVYFGRALHYVEVRQLASASDLSYAIDSLVGFVSSLIEHFHIDSAVSPEHTTDTRAEALYAATLNLLRARAVPHWVVQQKELFTAYGEVPLKRTHELRSVVCNYWPHIIEELHDRTCLDAAALGLFFQTERMLSDNSPPPL